MVMGMNMRKDKAGSCAGKGTKDIHGKAQKVGDQSISGQKYTYLLRGDVKVEHVELALLLGRSLGNAGHNHKLLGSGRTSNDGRQVVHRHADVETGNHLQGGQIPREDASIDRGRVNNDVVSFLHNVDGSDQVVVLSENSNDISSARGDNINNRSVNV